MTIEQALQGAKCIHFVGVGGSGIFPIVQILHGRGFKIQGSDNNPGDITSTEQAMGIKVMSGHSSQNIDGADVVIYSAAIMKDNPELLAARDSGIPVFRRCEALGYLTKLYENSICVGGTHGKTTTTAILTHMLVGAGYDPGAVIGGKLPSIGGYGRAGSSDIMTCESCEFTDTFLHLFPAISVVLNIGEDHLDYFGSLENIISSFSRFMSLASKFVIINEGDENSHKAAEGILKPKITFGFSSNSDYYPENIKAPSPSSWIFDLMHKGRYLVTLNLNVPGRHNILNALAACSAALQVGMKPEELAATIPSFTGAGRRFEIIGQTRGITIADDYAHHPTEIRATLETAMQMGYKTVWAVFQPFTYSRTSFLLDGFAESLAMADRVVMSEIMGGREHNTFSIHTKDLSEKIPGSEWFSSFEEIANHVMSRAQSGDLVITLGCGDIYKCAKMMLLK